MAHRTSSSPRAGLTLLEVLISLAIFLFAMVAVGHLLNLASQRAILGQLKQQGVFLCQSKLAEFSAGAVPLEAQIDVELEEDPEWTWSAECTAGEVPGLTEVKVTFHRPRPGGQIFAVSLTQFVLDPTLRGSTLDPAPTGSSTTPGAEPSTEGAAGGATP